MKRIILIIALTLCQLAIMAQNDGSIETSMTNAVKLYEEAKYQEALDAFQAIANLTQAQRTEEERQAYVASQTRAAECLQQLQRFEEAYKLCETTLQADMTEEARSRLNKLYVDNVLDYEENEETASEYIIQLKKILPLVDEVMRDTVFIAISLAWLTIYTSYATVNNMTTALSCLDSALTYSYMSGDPLLIASTLGTIGRTKENLYDILGAMDAYYKALDYASDAQSDRVYLRAATKLSGILEQLGMNDQIHILNVKTDSVASNTRNLSIKCSYYFDKSNVAFHSSDFTLAKQWLQKYYETVLQIRESDFADEKSNLSDEDSYWLALARIHTALANGEEAIKCLKNSIRLKRALNQTRQLVVPYTSLAYTHSLTGDSVKCFEYLDSVFLLLPSNAGPRDVARVIEARSKVHSEFKNYKLALDDIKKADEIITTYFGPNDYWRLDLLGRKQVIEERLGHYDEMLSTAKELGKMIKENYGENSFNYIGILSFVAYSESITGNMDSAKHHFIEASQKLRHQARAMLPYYTSDERKTFWNQMSYNVLRMTFAAAKADESQSQFTSLCYDDLVLLKSFLLESERSTYDLVKAGGSEKDVQDYISILSIRQKIKDLERGGEINNDSILHLKTKINQLEADLVTHISDFGDLVTFTDVGYHKVKSQLADNEVLIDFSDYISQTRGRIYAAYLVNRQQEFPLLHELFAESRLDSLHIEYLDQYYQSPYADSLYRLLWQPFKELVAEGSTVYYVPTQRLHQIALESLPLPDGSLLGDHYRFVRLSSARELLRMKSSIDFNAGAAAPCVALYGGLAYDMDGDELAAESGKYDISGMVALRGDIACADSLFVPLPGTRHEVDEIERIVKSRHLTAATYTGKQGTEASFVSLSGRSPQILHLATHGFYCTAAEADLSDYLRGYRDAMSLSGLALSGANAAWSGQELPQGVPDGILTSDNIARLDFGGTELVVLSACQTGRGQATSEGLYGLQRAFKKAGVQTLVLSLWNISDKAASQFMAAFYQSLLDPQTRGDKRRAFDQAKAAIRAQYPDPFYWASFIMLD